jgi:hypothetical protein
MYSRHIEVFGDEALVGLLSARERPGKRKNKEWRPHGLREAFAAQIPPETCIHIHIEK